MPAELGVPAILDTPVAVTADVVSRHYRPRRAVPVDDDANEALRLLKIAIRRAMRGRTIDQSAGLANCSTNTIARILRGENATIATAARIVSRLGGKLTIALRREKKYLRSDRKLQT